MSYQAAQAAMQVFGSVLSGMSSRSQVRAGNIIGKANARISNLVRQGRNEVEGAQGALARYVQGENNARLLNAAGKRQEAAGRTVARLRDAQAGATIQGRLRASEDLGRLAVASAFSGVTGGVVDMVAGALATREALREGAEKRRADQQVFEIDDLSRDELTNAVNSLDNRAILDNLDMTVDSHVNTPVQGSLLLDIVGSEAGMQATTAALNRGYNAAFAPTQVNDESGGHSGPSWFQQKFGDVLPSYLIPGSS